LYRIRREAFTLIELLVVVAVIALLAAILFPTFSQAREKARQAGCLSNHRQINLAVMVYLQDYDGRFPGRRTPTYGLHFPGPDGTWEKLPTQCCGDLARVSVAPLLRPYLRNTRVLQCPSDPSGEREANGNWDPRVTRISYGWPYGVSQGASFPNYPSERGGRVSGVPILLAEVSHPEHLFLSNQIALNIHSAERPGEARWIIALADGHVKYARFVDPWLPPEQRPFEWTLNNPRLPVDLEKPCKPYCREEAMRN
jgi:prepilin-type N-terminal cleavage/methylation domain-containing protein